MHKEAALITESFALNLYISNMINEEITIYYVKCKGKQNFYAAH